MFDLQHPMAALSTRRPYAAIEVVATRLARPAQPAKRA
jgi:hypothetical protein